MSKIAKAHLALIAANLIFGVTYAVAKQVMPVYLSPFALVFTRILGACMLFWITSLFLNREKVERKDFPRILLAALFGVAANQSVFLNGLNLTSPIDSSIIMTATPIIVLVVARILLKEPITVFKIIGIAAGATGAILLIVYSGRGGPGSGNPLGNSMIIANASFYAIYLVIIKPLLTKYHPVTMMKWIFLFGLILVSGPGIPALLETQLSTWTPDILWSVLFIVIGTTYFAYLLNNFSLQYVKPITVSIYIYSQPVVASMVALVLGQDVITVVKIFSALLVFTGVYFVSYSSGQTGRK
ncbi:MAG TPA: EamA/RhaT family transporter [Bacteroides sp.]|nr:EamA/RhaT family transporter [Bacteroides sp.]